jgi:hypothetical protein
LQYKGEAILKFYFLPVAKIKRVYILSYGHFPLTYAEAFKNNLSHSIHDTRAVKLLLKTIPKPEITV